MPEESLHVQMLGGFGIQLGGTSLPSIPKGPATLLAYLIVHRDREHTRDLLAGRFWSDTPDDTARRNLSQALWHINSRTKDTIGLLAVTANTVQFNPAIDVTVDAEIFERRLDDFERRLRANKQNVRASDLSAIVDSYRGDLLAGYYDETLTDEREKLRGRYRSAVSQLVQLTSSESDYETSLRHALSLVADEPYDEEGHREVLRLYALNGQPLAAERHYERFVKELDKQLQASPSAETATLMQRILDDAATPPVGFDDMDRDTTELVGRRAERSAVLNKIIELTNSGKGGIVLVEGEPGIGKTRLAEEIAKGAEWRRAQVLVGRHTETSALNPYEGLKKALGQVTLGLRGDRLRDAVEPLWLQQASSVLSGLTGFVESTERPKLEPAEEPWRTTEALARIILAQGRPKPAVLILEDVHLCDDDTMAVLNQLGERLIDSQVLVVLTYQLSAAQENDSIWHGLSQLEAEPGSSRVVVSPLEPAEVKELILAEVGPGRLSAAMTEQVIRLTDGNPYLVLELLRSPLELLDDPGFDIDPHDPDDTNPFGIEDHLLPRLTDLIARRIDSAPEHVRLVLEAVAAIGAPVKTSVVARAAELDDELAVDGLQRAVDLGFLVEREAGCDFEQTQTRRAVYEGIGFDRRSGLHGRIIDGLTHGGDHRMGAGQLAHHAWLAGQWQRAYQYHSLAAESALVANAFQTAAEHFTKADHAARSAGLEDYGRVEDLFENERILDILGRRTDQEQLLDRIEVVAEPVAALRVRCQSRRAWLLLHTDGVSDAVKVARAGAADARANGINPGRLLTIVGTALYRTGLLTASIEPLLEAINELRAAGLSAVEAQLMLGRTYAELHDADSSHRYLEDAYNEAKATADVRYQVEALGHLAIMWYGQAADLQVDKAFTEAIELAREIGYRFGEGNNLVNFGLFHINRGRAGVALELLDGAEAAYKSLAYGRGEAFVKMNRAWLLHWYLGDDAEAEQQATDAAVLFREFGDSRSEIMCQFVIAGSGRRLGRRRRARNRLADTLKRSNTTEDPQTDVRLLLGLALADMSLEQPEAAVEHLVAAHELCRNYELDTFAAILVALEARVRLSLDERDEALTLVERAIRANNPNAELAYLAAWWCAEVQRESGRHEEASDQVALAYELLTRSLAGLPDHLADAAWSSVPEHREILRAREEYFVHRVVVDIPLADAPTGRPLGPEDLVSATLTRSHPDDTDIASSVDRRRHRLLRIAAEAGEQGGAARLADFAEALGVSDRTIKRDLAILREEGHELASGRLSRENP